MRLRLDRFDAFRNDFLAAFTITDQAKRHEQRAKRQAAMRSG